MKKYRRGDHVKYKGSQKHKPEETYVWTSVLAGIYPRYIIQHPDGFPKGYFTSKVITPEGLPSVPEGMLQDDLLYIYALPGELQLVAAEEPAIEDEIIFDSDDHFEGGENDELK